MTYDSGNHAGPPDLRIIHYNDVYHVEPSSREPVGGIARFQTVCDYYAKDAAFQDLSDVMTLFSGDAFNPSLESSVTKGRHMVPVMNMLRTRISCLGYGGSRSRTKVLQLIMSLQEPRSRLRGEAVQSVGATMRLSLALCQCARSCTRREGPSR